MTGRWRPRRELAFTWHDASLVITLTWTRSGPGTPVAVSLDMPTTTPPARPARKTPARCATCKRFVSKAGCKVCLTVAPIVVAAAAAIVAASPLRREVLAPRLAPAAPVPALVREVLVCQTPVEATATAPVSQPQPVQALAVGTPTRKVRPWHGAWWLQRRGHLGMTPRWLEIGTYLAVVGLPLLGLIACR